MHGQREHVVGKMLAHREPVGRPGKARVRGLGVQGLRVVHRGGDALVPQVGGAAIPVLDDLGVDEVDMPNL